MSSNIYELPLNERIRILIRLEHLLKQLNTKTLNTNDLFLLLNSVEDILNILETDNIRAYLSEEVISIMTELLSWQDSQEVDQESLAQVLDDLNSIESRIIENPDVGVIAENNFLKEYRDQRKYAGGLSTVDFPRFNFWLHQEPSKFKEVFAEWQQIFEVYDWSIGLVLKLIRGTSFTSENIAKQGHFQENLKQDIEFKLIRVIVPENTPCFAEITGSRYHVTVRMVEDDWNFGTNTYKEDVKFTLSKCIKNSNL